jgi:hypothetical protein
VYAEVGEYCPLAVRHQVKLPSSIFNGGTALLIFQSAMNYMITSQFPHMSVIKVSYVSDQGVILQCLGDSDSYLTVQVLVMNQHVPFSIL